MTELYGVHDSGYISAVKSNETVYIHRLQSLDHWENVLGEISGDINEDSPVQITSNSGSGARNSASLSLFNVDDRYTPSKNSDIWYNRKFRILVGTALNGRIYWEPMGVFITSNANESDGVLSITAADKFAQLNGELGIGRCVSEFSTDISKGDIYIADLIREVLMRPIGNGYPLDPVMPLIDPYFSKTKLYADIALSAGQFYGEIITTLAKMYGADCYYDRSGRLVFRRKPSLNIPSWYMHKGYSWRFEENDSLIIGSPARSTALDGSNIITVCTDNTEGEVYSYTARNLSAESPLNIKTAGERYPDEPIVYISMGDTTRGSGEEKCRQYAEYLLMQQTANSVSDSFCCRLIPHIEVEDIISYKGEDRLVTGISYDLTSRQMQITSCNVAFLPDNYTLEV